MLLEVWVQQCLQAPWLWQGCVPAPSGPVLPVAAAVTMLVLGPHCQAMVKWLLGSSQSRG